AGLAPQWLRDRIRVALEPVFAGSPASCGEEAHAAIADDLRAVDAIRAKAADRLRAEVLAAVRAARADLPVLLHCHPDTRRVGAKRGVEPATLFAQAAGAALQCWGSIEEGAAMVSSVASQAPDGVPVAASLLAVANLGGRVASLAEDAATLRAAG